MKSLEPVQIKMPATWKRALKIYVEEWGTSMSGKIRNLLMKDPFFVEILRKVEDNEL